MTSKRPLFLPHYLPPMSFGGCEDVAITLAAKYHGNLYCPRPLEFRSRMVMDGRDLQAIFPARGIDLKDVYYETPGVRLPPADRVALLGVYWPDITALGMSHYPEARVMMIPFYHIRDGLSRAQIYSVSPAYRNTKVVIACSQVEADTLKQCWWHLKFEVIQHLPGVCVDFGSELPAPETFSDLLVPAKALDKGYLLFPSRPNKQIEWARKIATQLKLPLVGNKTYHVPGLVDATVDLDKCDPYKGAACMVTLGRHDSYNIGIAKALARGVPVIWDDGNTQITEIWSEFKSAIPVYKLDGQDSLDGAREHVEASKALIRARIQASVAKFDRIWANFNS